jgi:drug/metabolite transporter (DMT)-like permease
MIFLLFVFFIISSAFLVNKYIALFLSPSLFVAIRMGLSGILLGILYCRDLEIIKKFKDNALTITLIAIFTTFVPSLCRAYALQYITASRAAFWGTFEPFIASLWTYILYDVNLNRNQFIGCLLSVMAAIFFIIMDAKEGIFYGALLCTADLAQLSSHILSRFGWIQAQQFLQKNILTPIQFNAFSFMISGLTSFGLFLFQYWSVQNTAMPTILTDPKFILCLGYTIIIGNMIAYTLYAYAIKTQPITYVAIAGLSMPLFVHLLSSYFFKESLSYAFFISLSFIAIALFIFQKTSSHDTPEKDAE